MIDQLPMQERERLVAYLDGELASEDSRVVEERLRDDPNYRQCLRELQAAFDMLDELPSSGTSPQFTQATVTMVAMRAAAPQRRNAWLAWSAGLAAMLTVGVATYLMVGRQLDKPERAFLNDLPVIENVDLLINIDSLEFLEQLDESGVFDEAEEAVHGA